MLARPLRSFFAVAGVVLAGAAVGTTGAAQQDETSSDIPAMEALHEVIYPLWHEAWPNRNTALVKELLPAVEERVAEVEGVSLPGILRDRRPRWEAGVERLQAALAAYRDAVGRDDAPAMFGAVENLHAAYEGLVRTVRPAMKELDRFHVVLYGLYHHTVPDGRLEDVPAAAAELVSRCRVLSAAELPRRVEARAADVRAAIAALCEATVAFEKKVGNGDPEPIPAALELAHTRYRALERLFD